MYKKGGKLISFNKSNNIGDRVVHPLAMAIVVPPYHTQLGRATSANCTR